MCRGLTTVTRVEHVEEREMFLFVFLCGSWEYQCFFDVEPCQRWRPRQVEADDSIPGTAKTRQAAVDAQGSQCVQVPYRCWKGLKRQTWPMLAQLSRFLPVLFQDMSHVVQTNGTQNRLSREPFPFLAWCTPTDKSTLPCVQCRFREAKANNPSTQSWPGRMSPPRCEKRGSSVAMLRSSLVFHRGRYHKGIHCTCGHQFTLRLGLNDVGLVVAFVCIWICIIIHSIIPIFIGLGTV